MQGFEWKHSTRKHKAGRETQQCDGTERTFSDEYPGRANSPRGTRSPGHTGVRTDVEGVEVHLLPCSNEVDEQEVETVL